MGNSINDEPLITERWAYGASKANVDKYPPEDKSEMAHEDPYINNYFVTGSPLKAKIEVTSRSANPVSKAYVLAFEINQ